MALAAPGLGSNLDVNSIVTQLIAVERQPINTLDRREAGIQARISAFGTVRGALASFQTAVRGLSDTSRFLTFRASSSDEDVATLTANSRAAAGSYNLEVTTLAQSQKLASTGRADTTTAIGVGTLTIDVGAISGGTFNSTTGKYSGATFESNGSGSKTVTIDSSNNSLQGIRDAINAAKIGVTASIVNDGDEDSPYRLVLSSNSTGVDKSIKVSVSGDAALSDLLGYDPAGTQNLAQTQAAQNANFKLDGVSISKSSNTVTDVLEGINFTLQKADSTATLNVTRDTAAVQSSVQAFVKAYNDVNKVLSDITAYNPATGQAAVLQGDSAIRSIQDQVRGTLNRVLTGLTGDTTTLSQIGVSFQVDGTLSLDAGRLQSALSNDFNSVAGLFGAVGSSTDSLVQYVSSSRNTVPGNYAVNVTQLATQGRSVGAVDLSGGVNITSANNTLAVRINGVSSTITLEAGSYTATELASHIQDQINGNATFSAASISVNVDVNSNALRITSTRYGSSSNVSVTGGTAQADVFGTGTNTTGLDVAGTIGGVAATGSGQALTGTGSAQGLRVNIVGGSTGDRGTLSFSQGFALRLDKLVDNFLSNDGLLKGRTDGLAETVSDIGARRDALNLRLANLEQRLRAQFTALDQLVSRIQTTASFLEQQLSNLPGVSR